MIGLRRRCARCGGRASAYDWCPGCHAYTGRRWARLHRFVHNVVAHPLLVLCPPLGERLHDRTDPGGR